MPSHSMRCLNLNIALYILIQITTKFNNLQVSHHPPISAFYAEHYNKKIQLDGYTWTKSKFLGLSIGVHMIGKAVLSLIEFEEEYILTFPSAYGRSILTGWILKLNFTINKY